MFYPPNSALLAGETQHFAGRSLRRSGGILLRLPGTADGSGTTSAVAKPRASEAPMLVTMVTDIHIISPPFSPSGGSHQLFFVYTPCHPHTQYIYIYMYTYTLCAISTINYSQKPTLVSSLLGYHYLSNL